MTDMRMVSSSPSTTATNNINNPTNSTSSVSPDITGLTTYVNTIFHQMEEKFLAASDHVMNRMNELGKRIDTLETNIGDIISHLPKEETTTSSVKTTQQQTKS